MNNQTVPQTDLSSESSGGTSMLLRLQGQDTLAWEQFVELYAPLIFQWGKLQGLNSADSADVMQDVFSAVAVSIRSFKRQPGGTLRGWLWTITRNKIRDLFRNRNVEVAKGGSAAKFRMDEIAAPFESSDVSSQDHPSFAIESHRLLHRALDQIQPEFSDRSWTAFYRSVVQGDETRVIAEDLNISMAGVRQAKRRILRRLRQQLGDLD